MTSDHGAYAIEERNAITGNWQTLSVAYSLTQANGRLAQFIGEHPEKNPQRFRVVAIDAQDI